MPPASACCWSVAPRSCIRARANTSNVLIRHDFVDALFAGNALAVHDIESQLYGTSLGVNLTDAFPVEEGHVHHLRSVNRIRADGGIAQCDRERAPLRAASCTKPTAKSIPVVLAGSIRDDGPLPDVITDVIAAQRAMRAHVPEIGMALMVCTLLHSIAVGNLLPVFVQGHLRRHQSRERHEVDRSRFYAIDRPRHGCRFVLTRSVASRARTRPEEVVGCPITDDGRLGRMPNRDGFRFRKKHRIGIIAIEPQSSSESHSA